MATSARLDELKKKFDENPRRYFAPLANEYRKLGDLSQAIALCQAHLPNQPGQVSGHIVLAQSLYEAHELEESQQSFEAALDIDPENLIALRYLGDIAREQGDPAQARLWYERVLDADPRNDEISQLLKTVESAPAAAVGPDDARGATTPADGPPAVPAVPAEAPAPPSPWIPASPIATVHEDFPEPVEILNDDSAPPAPASVPVYESTTTDETILAGSAAPIPDDFFADEAPPQALSELEAVAEPIPDDWFALPALPSHAAEAAESERAAVPGFDDSFFPDLSQVTPTASPAITADAGESEPAAVISSEAPTPPFVAPLPEAFASAPTPPFLSAVEPEAASAVWEAPPIESVEAPPADEVEERQVVAGDALVLDDDSTAEFVVGGRESEAPADALPRVWSADAVEATAEPGDPGLAALDVVSASAADASVVEPVAPVEALESSETLLGYAEASLHEGAPDGFMVEYGEFVPPAEDDTPFIANTIAVPLEESDPYSVGAPELSAHEPFSIESTLGNQSPLAGGAPGAEAEQAFDVVDGLVSREVPEDVEGDLAESVEGLAAEAEPTPFVTETMAELYLQQGFHDEALAIYRQLLSQQPDDSALQDRVSALERGASSAVVAGLAPRDAVDRHGQSVRSFFAHFARREPRQRPERLGSDDSVEASRGGAPGASAAEGTYAGAATREEALTVPDDPSSAPSLTQLFASGSVSRADESAATTLASAFTTGGKETLPTRSGERELSLEHLFRDVPARSSGAVTLDEFYQGSSPGGSDPAAQRTEDGEEHDADIEQFTAWLEGLKKK